MIYFNNRNTKCITTFFYFVLLTYNSFSQQVSVGKRLVFDVEPRWGFVAPHHDYMAYFLEKNVSGIQVNIGLLTDGSKDWHQYYNYPQVGMGFYHSGLGNDKIYGKISSAYLYVDRSFFPNSNKFNLSNRISFGISYINKQFDLRTNSTNQVIGTPINVFIQYDLSASYSVSPNITVKWNVGMIHASNGSIKEPNKGFNIITTGIGFQYSLSKKQAIRCNNYVQVSDTNRYNLILGITSGWKSISRFDNQLYNVIGFSGEFLYKMSSKALVGAELSVYRDASMHEEFLNNGDSTFKSSDYYHIVLYPTYALQMGKLYFTFQPGVYLKCGFSPYGVISNKIGLQYLFAKNIVASLSIKAHWLAQADFIEFGLKYRLKIRQ